MEQNRKMVSRKEAAEFLGCTQQTVTNWVNSGAIKGHMINGKLFVDSDTLNALADTVSDIEESKRRMEVIREECRSIENELNEEINAKRAALRLYRCSSLSKVTRDTVISLIRSYGDHIPSMEREALCELVNCGNIHFASMAVGVDEGKIVRLADKACRRIGSTHIDKVMEENSYLRGRVGELSNELNDLKRGIVRKTDNDNPLFKKRIIDCDLTVRALNVLNCMGIKTVGDLVNSSRTDILKHRNAGKKTVTEIEDFLSANGLGFAML